MSASTTDWGLIGRQLRGVIRLDLRRALLSPRSLALYFLAFAPLLLVAIWSMTPFPTEEFSGPQEGVKVFTVLFEFYVRAAIFFSSMFLFVSLYRSEILERSLHYYFLTPVRRDVVALGKYVAALIACVGVFSVGTVAMFLTVASPWGWSELSNYLFSGPGLGNMMGYVGVVMLACAGYGALFLLVGTWFRNPVIPAAVILGWESINSVLPPVLKPFSVIYHLTSLYPIPLVGHIVEIVRKPLPGWMAVAGAIAFTALVLFIAGRKVRRMDLAYGGE